MMNPAYDGCTCSCHTEQSGMMHCVPCCYPPQAILRRSGPVINLDLDGVFANFLGYTRSLGIDYVASPAQAWSEISLIPRFFTQLPVLPGSLALFKALQHHGQRLRILTALPLPTGTLVTARADKREWVARHISNELEVVTVLGGVNKYLEAQAGDVLIDDQMRNLEPWIRAGGLGIHHTSVEKTLGELQELGLLQLDEDFYQRVQAQSFATVWSPGDGDLFEK